MCEDLLPLRGVMRTPPARTGLGTLPAAIALETALSKKLERRRFPLGDALGTARRPSGDELKAARRSSDGDDWPPMSAARGLVPRPFAGEPEGAGPRRLMCVALRSATLVPVGPRRGIGVASRTVPDVLAASSNISSRLVLPCPSATSTVLELLGGLCRVLLNSENGLLGEDLCGLELTTPIY